jgi:diacylglycerol kinase family enzyme
VEGDDAALAAAVGGRPGARVAFVPASASDLARAIGMVAGGAPAHGYSTELPCDLIRADADARPFVAVNMIVLGVAPDRQRRWSRTIRVRVTVDGRTCHDGDANAVVCASGEYLRGADVVPRGHPGDGRLEVQVYALAGRDRARLRGRVTAGVHLPHPGIRTVAGRMVEIESLGAAVPLEADGHPLDPARALRAEVVPEAFSLLV